jgi:hypothetical protein
MRGIILAAAVLALAGCSTIDRVRQMWPRAHDPVLVDRWVSANISVSQVDCAQTPTGWAMTVEPTEHLAQLAEFRRDPQAQNLRGLAAHTQKMSEGGSKMFCELAKKTAAQRLAVARTAWEGR